MKNYYWVSVFLLSVFTFVIHFDSSSQRRRAPTVPTINYDDKLYNALEWRSIGPFRGGRSAAVTGVPGNSNLFYFGATGGGVWIMADASLLVFDRSARMAWTPQSS